MNDEPKNLNQVMRQIELAVTRECMDDSEIKFIKHLIAENYIHFVAMINDRSFLNWGLWDKKIYSEYAAYWARIL